MINKIRKKFTKWYYDRGYRFGYHGFCAYWECPWYVRPLLIFFSPSCYFQCMAECIMDSFKRGIESVNKWVKENGTIIEQLQNMEENTVED